MVAGWHRELLQKGDARSGVIGTWKTNLALIGGLLLAAAGSVVRTAG